MKTLILLLFYDTADSPQCLPYYPEFQARGISVARSVNDISVEKAETLVVTDSEDTACRLEVEGFPVVGYEHDGIRLSCGEIIQSLSSLTPEYCETLNRSLTGRTAVFTSGPLALYPLSEAEYCDLYEAYRTEPFMLTPEQKNCTEADVRRQYRNRLAISFLTENSGMFRAELYGTPIGYGSVFEESSDYGPLTTVDYYVPPALRGRGYGTAILRALIAYARAETPERELYAYVHRDNRASLAVLRSCGFQIIRNSDPLLMRNP